MMLMGFQDCLQGKEATVWAAGILLAALEVSAVVMQLAGQASLPLVARILFVLLFGCVAWQQVICFRLRPSTGPRRRRRHAKKVGFTLSILAFAVFWSSLS